MKTVKNLIEANSRVWFYLKDQETKKHFAEDIRHHHGHYLNGAEVTGESCSYIMAVHSDMKVAQVTIAAWNASFNSNWSQTNLRNPSTPLHVDYARYIAGEPDYLCQTSPFTPV